jgi:hypothetical protein
VTTRHAAYLVVLAEDVREDEDEGIVTALHMVKGVADVQPVPASIDQVIATTRRDTMWVDALLDLVRTGPGTGQ